MTNPTAAFLVIGDEILSGRTKDANINYLAIELTAVGIDLKEVRVVSDDPSAIVSAVNDLRGAFDNVFTSGGIGPTHDDITADCIAKAFEVSIDVRDDARAILAARCEEMGTELNESRLRMARIPDTATLIDNPVSGAPGFTIGNVSVMAGVPKIFQGMVAAVVPTLVAGQPLVSQTWRVDRGEGVVAVPLAKLAEKYSGLSLGSYPFQIDGRYGTNIVARGVDGELVDAAIAELAVLFPKSSE